MTKKTRKQSKLKNPKETKQRKQHRDSKLVIVKEKKYCGGITSIGGSCKRAYGKCPNHKVKEISDEEVEKDVIEIFSDKESSSDEESPTTNSTLCGKSTNNGIPCRGKAGQCRIHDRNYIICGEKNKIGQPCLQTKGRCRYHTTFEERMEYIKTNLKEKDKVDTNFLQELKLNYEDIKNGKIKFSEIKEEPIKLRKAAYISFCYIMNHKNTVNQIALYFSTYSGAIEYIKNKFKKEIDQYLLYFYNTIQKSSNTEEFTKELVQSTNCYTCNNTVNIDYNITINNHIELKALFKEVDIVLGERICSACYVRSNKLIIETPTKQITMPEQYNNFDDYLNNLNNYFTKDRKESQFILQNIYEFIALENKGVTMNDIFNEFGIKILESTLLECKFIKKDINEENEIVYKYNNDNILYIPKVTEEHLNVLKELKEQYNSETFTFDYNNYIDITLLKCKIDKNIEKFNEYKYDSNINTDSKFSRDTVNTFLIENYKKLFYKEPPFLDKMTNMNKFVYTIVNNYLTDNKVSLFKVWYAVHKILNNDFEFPQKSFMDDICNIIYLKNNYPLFFIDDLNGYFNLKNYKNLCGIGVDEKEEKDEKVIKKRPRTRNFKIINDRAKLLQNSYIGGTKIRYYYCIDELECNLNDKLNFYANCDINNSKDIIFDMDHIPYLNPQVTIPVGKKKGNGFCTSFCAHSVNCLLTLFSFEDRLLLRILKENNVFIESKILYKNINYKELKDKVPKEKLNNWINDIKDKINKVAEKTRNQVHRKHSKEELQYLLNNYTVYFTSEGIRMKILSNSINKYEGLVWDYSHENSWKLFNFFLKYLNLSEENVTSDEQMYKVFCDLEEKCIPNAKLLPFLMHTHIMYYGRGFISKNFNFIVGDYELLLRRGLDDSKIWQEITNILIGDPIVDSDGNLIYYFV
ncbi:hypothetical protein ABK040_007758 [Willaertia magna]